MDYLKCLPPSVQIQGFCRICSVHVKLLLNTACARIRGDLIETFKIMKEIDKVNPTDFFTMTPNICMTRRHPMKLFKPALKKNLNCRKYFFTQIALNEWNGLPTEVINAETVNSFKNRLDKFWNKSRYGIKESNSLN